MTSNRWILRLFAGLFVLSLLAVLVLPLATRRMSANTATFDGIVGITEGATASGRLNLQALTTGNVREVGFRLSGPTPLAFTDKAAPYFLMGDNGGTPVGWDSTKVQDGAYSLRVTVTDSTGRRYIQKVSFSVANTAAPQLKLPVFVGSLDAAWQNWSWATLVDFASPTMRRTTAPVIAVTYQQPWSGMFLYADGYNISAASELRFWVHGGGLAGRQISLVLRDSSERDLRLQMISPQPNAWTEVVVPISGMFPDGKVRGIILQEFGGGAQPPFYIDDVAFVSVSLAQPLPPVAPVQPTAAPVQPTAAPVQPTPIPAPQQPDAFLATFDGAPASPQPFRAADWDITVHSRGRNQSSTLDPIAANHGADCGGPPATHTISSYDDAVFNCRNHIMTAINGADYGVIYLTPNRMADFSKGETVIRFDMSTLRTSERDWVDLWITPYEENLQFPLENWLPDLQGAPRRAVHVRMYLTGPTNNMTAFAAAIVRNFAYEKLPTTGDWRGYENVLTPDAARRDTFEVRLTRTSIKVGLPNYNYWWVDTSFADLGWDQGIVQLGHHSYNPTKCANCQPNTWHWDNVSIAPARPFTMLQADVDVATGANPVRVQFTQPAPANANLRFSGIGAQLELSFDGGASWRPAQRQAQEGNAAHHSSSFWMPVPQGTQAVMVRGQSWAGGNWYMRDFAIWSR